MWRVKVRTAIVGSWGGIPSAPESVRAWLLSCLGGSPASGVCRLSSGYCANLLGTLWCSCQPPIAYLQSSALWFNKMAAGFYHNDVPMLARRPSAALLREYFMRTTLSLVTLFVTALLYGCSAVDSKVGENIPEAELYQQAAYALKKEEFTVAIERLRALEARYPFGPFASQGQLDLIYALYQSDELDAAQMAAERFIRLHPTHLDVDYAYYMRGLAANNADLGIIERYMPVDLSRRDPGLATESFTYFGELLQRFPHSRYAADARQRMIYLRNRRARYEMHVANYYLKRKAYIAAINRGRYVVDHLQGTPSTEEALAVIIEGYEHLNLPRPAAEALAVLRTNFPDSTRLNDKGEFVGYRVYGDVDPSLFSTLTFGLFDSSKKFTGPAPQSSGSQE